MAIEKKILCPLMGAPCVEDGALRDGELVACRFWVTVHGKHPQTGEAINTSDCAFAWTPILLIENSKEQRNTGAELNAMRNESVENVKRLGSALLAASNPELLKAILERPDNAALPPTTP